MNLSQAIREGSKNTDKCKADPIRTDAEGNIVKSCAIGSALLTALGPVKLIRLVNATDNYFKVFSKEFPIANLPKEKFKNKLGDLLESKKKPRKGNIIIQHAEDLSSVLWILNDPYDMSREEIADWVESIEQELEQNQQDNETIESNT